MFTAIFAFVVILGLLVFVHELGHFLMAKKAGMKVEEFGFGFPPRLWGFKKGDTIYSINWIPMGGFVKIKGESGDNRHEADSFSAKSIPKRFAVLIAGVVMNLFLAGALFSGGYMVGLPTIVGDTAPKGATVEDEAIRIAQVLPGSPAEEAGLKVGESILAIDGLVFETDKEARDYIGSHGAGGITVLLQKEDGTNYEKRINARDLPEYGIIGIGVGLMKTATVSYPIHLAVFHGFVDAFRLCWEVLRTFGSLLANLVLHGSVSADLSGPVGIAVMTGEVAKLGFVHLLQFAAVLSINLAVINALPFPALDGGRILFLLIEAVRRRPVSERVEGIAHSAGFVLLMILVLLVTYRDLVRYGGSILGAIFPVSS